MTAVETTVTHASDDKSVISIVLEEMRTASVPDNDLSRLFAKYARVLTAIYSRPSWSLTLRDNIASSLPLRSQFPLTGRRVRMPTLLPLWRATRTTGKQCGLTATGDYQPSLRSPWLAA
ncbi:MAG: hypothetical protein RPT94_12325, partial [Candidatus Sedimenticola sp. (ex Thyasira tokunagai)]